MRINHRDYDSARRAPVEATGIKGGTVLTQATVRRQTLTQTFRSSQGLRRHKLTLAPMEQLSAKYRSKASACRSRSTTGCRSPAASFVTTTRRRFHVRRATALRINSSSAQRNSHGARPRLRHLGRQRRPSRARQPLSWLQMSRPRPDPLDRSLRDHLQLDEALGHGRRGIRRGDHTYLQCLASERVVHVELAAELGNDLTRRRIEEPD